MVVVEGTNRCELSLVLEGDLAMTKVYDTPSNVSTHPGQVNLDGPGGLALSLTPEAALTTASRIEHAALDALIAKHQKQADGEDGEPLL